MVCDCIFLEVSEPEAPVHESPLVPVTEHEETYDMFQCTVVVFPSGTTDGFICR